MEEWVVEMTNEYKKNLTNELEGLLKQIEKDARKLSKEKKHINEIKKNFENGKFSEIKESLLNPKIEDIERDYPESKGLLHSLNEIADKEIEKSLSHLFKNLKSEIEKLDLKLDWWFPEVVEGSLPKITVNKMIEIEIDRKNNKVKVNDQIIKGFNINEICSAISKENKRLFSRKFNADRFLENLFDAYLTLTKKKNYNLGDAIPILDVYHLLILSNQPKKFWNNPIKSNFKPYMTDEFSVDVSRLLKEKKVETKNGFKLELVSSRSPKDSIFLAMPNGDRVYRGMIRFKRVKNE